MNCVPGAARCLGTDVYALIKVGGADRSEEHAGHLAWHEAEVRRWCGCVRILVSGMGIVLSSIGLIVFSGIGLIVFGGIGLIVFGGIGFIAFSGIGLIVFSGILVVLSGIVGSGQAQCQDSHKGDGMIIRRHVSHKIGKCSVKQILPSVN